MTVAVLFARQDSVYKSMSNCDVYDIARDARTYRGPLPVIAHPPCRAWGQLRKLANPRSDEKDLARWAVGAVRRWGGVLEHPVASTLWDDQNLPWGGEVDEYGGFSLVVDQFWWGHEARKRTVLYICGCDRRSVPDMPLALGDAPRICGSSGRRRDGGRLHAGDPGFRSEISKEAREATPPEFAEWLFKLAATCSKFTT